MKIVINRANRSFWYSFKPREEIRISSRKTLGSLLGIDGLKTDIICNETLAESGETRRVVKELTDIARERRTEIPFSIPHGGIDGYEITAFCSDQEVEQLYPLSTTEEIQLREEFERDKRYQKATGYYKKREAACVGIGTLTSGLVCAGGGPIGLACTIFGAGLIAAYGVYRRRPKEK